MASERRIPITVIVLRRELTAEEVVMVKGYFPDQDVQFLKTDPRDYLEHDALCMRFNRPIVILPLERPIPSLAMEHGVPHATITPDGLMELLPLVPQFKPFKPQ